MAARIGAYTHNKMQPTPEYAAWKASPGPDTYRTLLASLEKPIQSALTTYGAGDPALRMRARILAAQAIQSYDPSKGASLNTHVFQTLQRLQRIRAERSSALHIPENARLDAAAIRRFRAEYKESHNGLEPSEQIISDKLSLSPKRLRRAGLGTEYAESQMTTEKGDAPQSRTAENVWADFVYQDLDDRNRNILKWTTGYQGAKIAPKTEIAKRLGITPAAVSQRVGQIADKLAEGLPE